jgi:benzoylformate decarboxylase
MVHAPRPRPDVPPVPADGAPLHPAHVFAALADRLPADSTYLEECPSTRRLLLDLVPVRQPFGFVTPATGGLGFAVPAAAGIRLSRPDRPVVAVVGDGASLYTVQALWSAQKYGAGVLYVVLSNGGYAVMDRLATAAGSAPAWPRFPEISIAALARGLGCAAERITTHAELIDVLDRVLPGLADRREPLVLDVAVSS